MTLASLPMYDLAPLREATDVWWAGLARAFEAEGIGRVPATLTRGGDTLAQWRSDELLFSQTCGYPLTHDLEGAVSLVAAPCYAAPHCENANYRSLILVRRDDPVRDLADLRGRCAVVNAPDSQSGYNALRAAIAPLAGGGAFFAAVKVSGGHAESLAMVAHGDADVCACDCVTFALWERCEPERTEGLRTLALSPMAPSLPYITRAQADDDLIARLRAGLRAAMDDPTLAAVRQALLLRDIEVLPLDAYSRILKIEQDAVAQGYPEVV